MAHREVGPRGDLRECFQRGLVSGQPGVISASCGLGVLHSGKSARSVWGFSVKCTEGVNRYAENTLMVLRV